MELNNRQLKILQAIIKNYLDTAEPVGSRTISKKYDLGISSATIRNEMSDLEELGFIVQPHTSAGRIPTDKGYRLYVDDLMKYEELNITSIESIKNMLQHKVATVDCLLQEISKILSVLTNYPTMTSTSNYKKTSLKYMQLIPLDEKSIILVIITDGNIVKNHVINVTKIIDKDELNDLSDILNKYLKGLTLEDINLELIQKIKYKMGNSSEILNSILEAINSTIEVADDIDVYTSGATNILNFPEFNDLSRAKNLISTLEEKQMILNMLKGAKNNQTNSNIKISIGGENSFDQIKDCSVITTTYRIGGKEIGSIGIIGPTRMDYARVVSTLNYLVKNIDPRGNQLKE